MEKLHTIRACKRASPSDGLLLRDGTRHRVLVNSSGSVTRFGREYEALAGGSLPAGRYYAPQTPSRTGNVETVRMRGGKEGIVRRWDPATGAFRYTRLGRAFYGQRRTQFAVKVSALYSASTPPAKMDRTCAWMRESRCAGVRFCGSDMGVDTG